MGKREKKMYADIENSKLSHLAFEKMLKICNSTVSRVAKGFNDPLTIDDKRGARRKPGAACRKTEGKVRSNFTRNPNILTFMWPKRSVFSKFTSRRYRQEA